MTASARPLFSGRTDQRDWLIEAGLPLTALQASAGGVVPGPIHIPAVLQLVRQARAYGIAIERNITLLGERGRIHSAVRAQPDAIGDGCAIDFLTWQEDLSNAQPRATGSGIHPQALRLFCEIFLEIDDDGRIVSAQGFGHDTRQAVNLFKNNSGHPWQHCVDYDAPLPRTDTEGNAGFIKLIGSQRRWTAHFLDGATGPRREIAFLPENAPPEMPAPAVESAEESLMSDELIPVLAQPIARIIANANTICSQLAGPLAANYARYAEDIAVSGDYLHSMLEDLSEVDVVNDDQIKVFRESIDLADVAAKAAEMLSAAAQKKRISVIVPEEGVPVRGVGDHRRALQIAINLLTNAIRYSPQESRITLNAWIDEGLAYLSVSDEGEGIAPGALALVFEKFERLGRSGDGGTGLGLYISRRLARAMNGELSVASTLGGGSEFCLSLAKDRRHP